MTRFEKSWNITPNFLKSSHILYRPAYEDRTDSVPKRRHIKFRRRGITQTTFRTRRKFKIKKLVFCWKMCVRVNIWFLVEMKIVSHTFVEKKSKPTSYVQKFLFFYQKSQQFVTVFLNRRPARPGDGPWHQLYRAARGSPGICHFSFLNSFHK